jgi:nitrogenase-associated protein
VVDVVFYEKPGCINSMWQKAILMAFGHRVFARNLLEEPWSAERLRSFFGRLPVAEWFNASAPRIKSGEVLPQSLDESQALAAMIADPLLIRRPLMVTSEGRSASFERGPVLDALGIVLAPEADLQTCPKSTSLQACRPAAGAM